MPLLNVMEHGALEPQHMLSKSNRGSLSFSFNLEAATKYCFYFLIKLWRELWAWLQQRRRRLVWQWLVWKDFVVNWGFADLPCFSIR